MLNPSGNAPIDERKTKKDPAATYSPAKSSTIGVKGLDFRVRDGNGYDTFALATGSTSLEMHYLVVNTSFSEGLNLRSAQSIVSRIYIIIWSSLTAD